MDTKSDDSAGSDSLDKTLQKKCVVDDCGQGEGEGVKAVAPDNEQHDNSGHKTGAQEKSERQEAAAATATTNAFETKVTQISKDLKETSLAETTHSNNADNTNTTASTDSLTSDGGSGGGGGIDMDTSQSGGLNDSMDDQEGRSKKVRFHPDVKENDGGNRVIPKKKKKLKLSSSDGDSPAGCSSRDDGMDLDDDDECDEEEDFDLAKTIAEAQDYLKSHPLTFVRPQDKNARLMQNGLLEEEDLPQVCDSSEDDEDVYEQVPPENGVQRILGKQTRSGQVEFLLRYAGRVGLFWESNDFITKQCPNLLNLYEQNRERRQVRLMRHVAKRQNLRQRYTDF